MASSAQTGNGEDGVVRGAGSSADQHITGEPETGEFLTDKAPTSGTPSHGSSNAGINQRDGYGADPGDGEPGRA